MDFSISYLAHFIGARLDERWLAGITNPNEGKRLLDSLNAHITNYGAISARGGHLFEPVPYDGQILTSKREMLMRDNFSVIEILGRPALFSNSRISQADLPDGLYAADLRGGDEVDFAAVEPRVIVNHTGSIITKEPLDFGEKGFISLDDDSSPNFLGYDMTVEEFAAAEFEPDEEIDEDQTDDEDTGMGGMNL